MLEEFRDHRQGQWYEYHLEMGEEYHSQEPTYECSDGTILHGKPVGTDSEAADVLVRLLDTCDRNRIDLFAAWRRKVDYNWTRPTRHGGKAL